jgi:hypothetical protein
MGKIAEHDEILTLLPWFVNESLSDRERQKVLLHLEDCGTCRQERDQLKRLHLAVSEDVEGEIPDYRFAFRKLSSRIDAAEANHLSTATSNIPESHEARSGRLRYLPYAVAACLALAVGAVALLNSPPSVQVESYRTLSNSVSTTGIAHRVSVTFEQPIQADALRAALIETRSSIVEGPDDEGAYLLEVRIPDNMTDGEFIHSIQAIDGVQHAAFSVADHPTP